MLRSYYDRPGGPEGKKKKSPPGTGEPPKAPAGENPSVPEKPRLKERLSKGVKGWKSRLRKWQKDRKKWKWTRKRRNAAIVLLLLLVFALLGRMVMLLVWEYGGEQRDWREELSITSIDRGELGTGVTMQLSDQVGKPLAAQEIYQKVNPSVVGIRAMMEDGISFGSGVVMTEDGYVITNAHVIAGAHRADVLFADGTRRGADLLGYDADADLAVLKVDTHDLVPAEFVDAATLQVGDPAYAIGNPLGEQLQGTFTDGIISAPSRSVVQDGRAVDLIQTTAALNSGNSGGALINQAGQVVGITNMKMMSEEETIEGLGFAIPSASVKEVVDQLIDTGTYRGQPVLGITATEQAAEEDAPAGVLVVAVEPGSDAERVGVQPGDIIIAAQGLTVRTMDDLALAKEGLDIGDQMTLTVWRKSGERTLKVRLVGSSEMGQ